MDVQAEPQNPFDRRSGLDRDRRNRRDENAQSEHDRIEAAQFMLGTRQREEAVLRATHLGDRSNGVSEIRARETLAEMLHLQERIVAQTIPVPARGGRRRRDTVIDLEPGPQQRKSKPWRSLFLMLVLASLVAGSVLIAADQNLFQL